MDITDNTALLSYAINNLWSSPEENKQFQVKINRLSPKTGYSFNFSYMGAWRTLPIKGKFFHVFTVGGLDPRYWNLVQTIFIRNPLDRWVNLSAICKKRGLLVDVYNDHGLQFSRSHTWVMRSYDGMLLFAFEKLRNFPTAEVDNFYFRCYTPSILHDDQEQTTPSDNPFHFETMLYENNIELGTFNSRYLFYKNKSGYTGVFVNGVAFNGRPNQIPNLTLGDVVEIWHDPSVIKTETYDYFTLPAYRSEMDAKRKLIIHPPKVKGNFDFRYFDDCDYYIFGTSGKGRYFNRNDPTAVRQLTHIDVAIADDLVLALTNNADLNVLRDNKITVLVRDTTWRYSWPHDAQRIRYLYRLPDADIIKAFRGERANMPEWTANELESGAVMSFNRSQFLELGREKALRAVGYNAATRVLSEPIIETTNVPGELSLNVPTTFVARFTAWEHDANGKLLGYYNETNTSRYLAKNPDCKLVEFTLGTTGRFINYSVIFQNTPVDKDYDLRVFLTRFNITTYEPVGDWIDITDDNDKYEIVNGLLVIKNVDTVNYRVVLLTNERSLGYTFELDHIDHSLSFALTNIYEGGGFPTKVVFANLDVWMNGHPLIDNVDWYLEDGYIHIVNREFVRPGSQEITVRNHGTWEVIDKPKTETELGFVDGGVIGRFATYNLRGDRATRTVIGGRLVITDNVKHAERHVPDDLLNPLNGLPYMVKHIHSPIKGVVDYKNFSMIDEAREVDLRVSDYLTLWLSKPSTHAEEVINEPNQPDFPVGSGTPVIGNVLDKYRLFSPFMNVVVNGLLNGLINVPEPDFDEEFYSNQDIKEALVNYEWWLTVDPALKGIDLRYFEIRPYSNYEKLTVTPRQLVFIKQVNDLYFDGLLTIETNFEVSHNV